MTVVRGRDSLPLLWISPAVGGTGPTYRTVARSPPQDTRRPTAAAVASSIAPPGVVPVSNWGEAGDRGTTGSPRNLSNTESTPRVVDTRQLRGRSQVLQKAEFEKINFDVAENVDLLKR